MQWSRKEDNILSPPQDIPYSLLPPDLFSSTVLTTTRSVYVLLVFLPVFTQLNANFMKAGICSTPQHAGT